MSESDTVTPTSNSAQCAQNNATPNTTEGHKNPEWTPLAGHCFGQGANIK